MTPRRRATARVDARRRHQVLARTLRIADAKARQTHPQPRPDYANPSYGLTAKQAHAHRRIARCTCGAWVLLTSAQWLDLVEFDIRAECPHYGRPEAP